MHQEREIHQTRPQGPLRNFTYMLPCSGDGDAPEWLCIDPYDGEAILAWPYKGKLRAILNTHEHWDHIRGNALLKKRTGCEVYAHSAAAAAIPEITHTLRDGEKIPLSKTHTLNIIETPGHTPAGLTFELEGEHGPVALFTGDTLFPAGVGNCHNGGDPDVLFETITDTFSRYPPTVFIYPGHDYLGNNLRFTLSRSPGNVKAQRLLALWEEKKKKNESYVTTYGEEKEINTFLRTDDPEIISLLEGDTSGPRQVFLRLRELRDRW